MSIDRRVLPAVGVSGSHSSRSVLDSQVRGVAAQLAIYLFNSLVVSLEERVRFLTSSSSFLFLSGKKELIFEYIMYVFRKDVCPFFTVSGNDILSELTFK